MPIESESHMMDAHLWQPELWETPEFMRVLDRDRLSRVHMLMEPEFMSHGGNIRDISLPDLTSFAHSSGEVWAAEAGGKVMACCTLTLLHGQSQDFWYLNNGVVHQSIRHQGGTVMEGLVRSCTGISRSPTRYLVLTVACGHLKRIGFTETSLSTLQHIDDSIAGIVQQKIRPGSPVHIMALAKESI